MAKFCAWCGQSLSEGQVFCPSCGRVADGSGGNPQQPVQNAPPQPQQPQQTVSPQNIPSQPVQPVPPQQPQQPAWPQSAPQQPAYPPAPSAGGGMSKGALIGILAGVVVLALAAIGGFIWPGFFLSGQKAAETTPAPEVTASAETPQPTAAPSGGNSGALPGLPAVAVTPVPTEEPEDLRFANPFVDVVPSDYFFNPVAWSVHNGVTTASPRFQPNLSSTRAQALTFIWRAVGSPEPALTVSPYSDVSPSDYYYKPVLWSFEKGVASNTGDGRFHGDDPVTRGQAATFLYRAVDAPAVTARNPFTDVSPADYYYDAVLWAYENGVTSGTSETTFDPDGSVNRAQIITFIYRTFGDGQIYEETDDGAADFEKLGLNAMTVSESPWGPFTYRTTCYENKSEKTYGEVTVTDYTVAPLDDYDLTMAEEMGWDLTGYECRSISFNVRFNDWGSQNYGVTMGNCLEDYYTVRLHDDTLYSGTDADGYDFVGYDVQWKDRIWPCYRWVNGEWSDWENDETSYYYWAMFYVPVGYDGTVVGFRDSGIPWPENGYIFDFDSTEDFLLFRLD